MAGVAQPVEDVEQVEMVGLADVGLAAGSSHVPPSPPERRSSFLFLAIIIEAPNPAPSATPTPRPSARLSVAIPIAVPTAMPTPMPIGMNATFLFVGSPI